MIRKDLTPKVVFAAVEAYRLVYKLADEEGGMPRHLLSLLVVILVAPGVAAHTDISPDEVQRMIRDGENPIIVDVREYGEFCGSFEHIDDAVSLPWISDVLEARFAELPTDRKIVAVCASGGRSHQAASFLDTKGFGEVYDMQGGMGAWTSDTEPCYAESTLELSKTAGSVEIDWTPTSGVQDYDLIRGFVDSLTATDTTVDLGAAECLAYGSPFTEHVDGGIMLPEAYFYLSRQHDGSWGESSQQQTRISVSPTCN